MQPHASKAPGPIKHRQLDLHLASWRSANNTTTTGVARVEFLVGRATDLMELEVYVPLIGNTGVTSIAAGIGINSTSTNSANNFGASAEVVANGVYGTALGTYRAVPSEGYSYAQWLEASVASGTSTWYTFSAANYRQAGLTGHIWQ